RHKQVLKTENSGKRIALLENEHSKSFAKWLREEVERELAIDKESVIRKTVNMYQFARKNKPNVYSHVQVTGSVLGLPNVTTWDEIEKKIGARKSKTCADKAKGKRKVSCGS
ncbi:hypothetical protein Tco_0855962, partial [Tanacetum coccineum]